MESVESEVGIEGGCSTNNLDPLENTNDQEMNNTDRLDNVVEKSCNEAFEIENNPGSNTGKLSSNKKQKAPVSKKGKRVYRKKRLRAKENATDSGSGESALFKKAKMDKEDEDNVSLKSNGTRDSEETVESGSARSRRSHRTAKPNHFYSNYELDSGNESESGKIKFKGVRIADDEYSPVKEPKTKTPKPTTKLHKKKLEDCSQKSDVSENEQSSTSTAAPTNQTGENENLANSVSKDETCENENFSIDTPKIVPCEFENLEGDTLQLKPEPDADLETILPEQLDAEKYSEVPLDITPTRGVLQQIPSITDISHSNGQTSRLSSLNNIKIASVSSIACTPSPIQPKIRGKGFTNDQSQVACDFMANTLKSTAHLGNLVNTKANEFIEKKVKNDYMTDAHRLQFCMEKTFNFFNLARQNLTALERNIKKQYLYFMVTNKFDQILKNDKSTNEFLTKNNMSFEKKETQSLPEIKVDSDSDCEIVEEGTITKTLPVELDILRRVERNGISWKAQRGSFSSECSDGSKKIHIPGLSKSIVLNKDIQVKKVITPKHSTNQSFFREDGRTLKPPDIKEKWKSHKSVKKLEKMTLILGWLDLAYRQVSDNFYSMVKKIEKQKRVDSCSDLGDSCSDNDFSDELENLTFSSVGAEIKQTFPKTLVNLCIEKLNESFIFTEEREALPKNYPKHIPDSSREFLLQDNFEAYSDFENSESLQIDKYNLLDMIYESDVDYSKLEKIPKPILQSRKILSKKKTNSVLNTSPGKLDKALKDLLRSSSDSDIEDILFGKKKKLKKRVKKTRQYSKEPDASDHNISEGKDGSEENEDWTKYSHLKNDPKLYYDTSVCLHSLESEILQPFQEYLKEVQQDVEIDKLLDFSTLFRQKIEKTQSDVDLKLKIFTKRKLSDGRPTEQNLLSLITSDKMNELSISSEVENENLESEGSVHSKSSPVPEETDDFANTFKLKTNTMAKDLLMSSSSCDLSETSNSFDMCKPKKLTKKQNKNLRSDNMSSDSVAKTDDELSSNGRKKHHKDDENNDEEIKNNNNNLKGEVTPQKNNKDNIKNTQDQFLKEISKLSRDDKKLGSKRKKKSQLDSEDEKRRWKQKRDRLSRKEESKANERRSSESNDNGISSSLDSHDDENSNEDEKSDSEILSDFSSLTSNSLSSINGGKNSNQQTPKTPRTRNLLAHTALMNVSSEDEIDNDEKTASKIISSEITILETPSKGRKNIRELLKDDNLMDATKLAAKEEEERLRRLSEKNSLLTELMSSISPRKSESKAPSLILDIDIETKEPLVSVHPALVKIMKPHQIEGVKFMWDTCFESLKMVKNKQPGSGCILAHCMGLGKSLQVIALTHSVLTSKLVPIRTVLICCPLSTVLNWADEFQKWLRKTESGDEIKIFELSKYKKNYERGFHLEDWQKTGGVFLIGYEMFRLLTNLKEASGVKPHVIKKIHDTLLDPGPDIVVCDEGHLLKNDSTALAKVMHKIKTRRRIVLTGTPLQNNLKEYYCMVNFVKPNLLGTRREYFNRFENPILNGQHRDSSKQDINLMKKRSHVLHKMLEGCVQRMEASILYKYLPRKQEFVLLITLSECQANIYEHYLNNYARSSQSKGTSLLKDFHTLQKVWTHPRTLYKFLLKSREKKIENKRIKEEPRAIPNVICLEDAGIIPEETLAELDNTDWWRKYINNDEMDNLKTSPKFSIALSLLDESIQEGDKMLIFCTSLFTLDAMEFFLHKYKGWDLGKHYYRLDGSVSLENRQKWCRQFNSERNEEVKLFLISTRAGGLGINMIAANRVIIMDVSWNPSHDIQSIFRVYRFGQKKDCYIYRLVTLGTMEEKIYERSVTKQAVSCRVVDEQQIDRHYSITELSELYTFNRVPTGPQPVPSIPSDHVLATVLATSMMDSSGLPAVWSLHEHDSLLRDLHEEQLGEEERRTAWLEYEAERTQQNQVVLSNPESILPDKNPLSMWPVKPRVSAYPIGPIMTNQIRYNIPGQHGQPRHIGIHGLEGPSILPDGGIRPIHSGSLQPFPLSNSIRPNFDSIKRHGNRKHFRPNLPHSYNLGRYDTSRSRNIVESTNHAFSNIKISNVVGNNTSKASKGPQNLRKRKNKIPQIVNNEGGVIDLSSLPDTPDKDKILKATKRGSTSEKKKNLRTPAKSPRAKDLRRKSVGNYSPTVPAKRLNFDNSVENNSNCITMVETVNVPESAEQEYLPESASEEIIQLD